MGAENLSGRTIASYRLLERIGEGGTATVYRAEHAERGTCAVKILRERMRADKIAVKRFLREADYGARVRHENVVTTYDFGEEDGLFYLALEWAEGEPLADYAERAGSLEPSLVAHIMAQLAGAIAVAHEAGIVHRDLKPENIMFDPKARMAKLLDFGIARDQQEDPSERLTRSGFFVGSLNYVAPEALSGALVGESADTYSLATIAYYLLTDRASLRWPVATGDLPTAADAAAAAAARDADRQSPVPGASRPPSCAACRASRRSDIPPIRAFADDLQQVAAAGPAAPSASRAPAAGGSRQRIPGEHQVPVRPKAGGMSSEDHAALVALLRARSFRRGQFTLASGRPIFVLRRRPSDHDVGQRSEPDRAAGLAGDTRSRLGPGAGGGSHARSRPRCLCDCRGQLFASPP